MALLRLEGWRDRVWRTPPWMIIVRDLVCLILGVWGLIVEELSGKADLGRMAFFAALIVAPGLWAAAWLGRSPTAPPSLPPPAEPSQSSSSSPGS